VRNVSQASAVPAYGVWPRSRGHPSGRGRGTPGIGRRCRPRAAHRVAIEARAAQARTGTDLSLHRRHEIDCFRQVARERRQGIARPNFDEVVKACCREVRACLGGLGGLKLRPDEPSTAVVSQSRREIKQLTFRKGTCKVPESRLAGSTSANSRATTAARGRLVNVAMGLLCPERSH
jgi:hypothetical protein